MNKKDVLSWSLFYLKFTLGFVAISLCAGLVMVSANYALEYTSNELQSWDDYLDDFKLIFYSFLLCGGLIVAHLMFKHVRQNYKEKKYRLRHEKQAKQQKGD